MSIDSSKSKVLQRLQRSTAGLSSRDIARSVKLKPTDVSRILLELQKERLAERLAGRWKATHGSTGSLASDRPAPRFRSTTSQLQPLQSDASASTGSEQVVSPRSSRSEPSISEEPDLVPHKHLVDHRSSRWGQFRQLCKYYAECIRLDQKATIHAKADEEFSKIVCIGGGITTARSFTIETSPSWHEWMKNLQKEQFVFLGYPLNRYQWKDSKSDAQIDYLSPVFIQPFIHEVKGTSLHLQAAGSVRINEGWLEKRLPNVEQRRAFIELCDISEDGDAEVQDPWVQYARLLQHFYPDWCAEPINPNQLTATPPLNQIAEDGVYNRAGLILSRAWRYTKRLYNELVEIGSFIPDEALDRTALTRLFPHDPPHSPDLSEIDSGSGLSGVQLPSLNHEQREACEAAADKKLSVIVGPPGTGKSRVVAAAMTQQAIVGSNSLFASRNHRALEAVVPRVSAFTEPYPLILRLAQPWGDPVDHSLELAIQELVFSPPPQHESQVPAMRERLKKRIAHYREASEQITKITSVRRDLRLGLSELDEAIMELPDSFQESFQFQELAPKRNALDLTIAGLRPKTKFGFSLSYFKDLFQYKDRLARFLQDARNLDNDLRLAFDRNKKLPKATPAGTPEQLATFYRKALVFWIPFLNANEQAFNISQFRLRRGELPELQTAYEREHECSQQVVMQSEETFREMSRMVGASLSDQDRALLASVNAAIQNQSGIDSESDKRRLSNAMRKTFPIFLRNYPLAATTNLSVGRDIPLHSAIYDLLIIDEASQCDIASVIPLLFRAKRSMIVGDPMQLTHVTTLSAAADKCLRSQFGLLELDLERFSYRTSSMFHLANTSPVVDSRVRLRQHHRCHPEIADYCNETFYKSGWTVLTERSDDGGLRWTQVDDDCEAAVGGGSVSNRQIAAIVRELERLRDDGYVGTIGVVTPFRQQANRIRDAVGQAIDPGKLKAWKFHVDTADGFQGDEREIIFLSLVGGENLKQGSIRFLSNSPNRFNVAASRAQKLLHVFGDMDWASGFNAKHIQILALRCKNAEQQRVASFQAPFRKDLVGPVWEPKLAEELKAASIPFHQQYPTCGRYLDFALIKPGLKLDVEVDGEAYHRDEQGNRVSEDIVRDQVLVADGWKILRFWVYELREDMPACIEKIRAAWEQ